VRPKVLEIRVIVGVIGEDENECAENETYADENLTIE